MRSKSAPGSSTPTSRPTDDLIVAKFFSLPWLARVGLGGTGLIAIVAAAIYVIAAFTAPNPILRIALRCLPVVPIAVWTLWFDPSRPFSGESVLTRTVGRLVLLVVVMAFAIGVLGLALNWLYDPARVI